MRSHNAAYNAGPKDVSLDQIRRSHPSCPPTLLRTKPEISRASESMLVAARKFLSGHLMV